MENFQVYRDIQARTGGDIYIGVVGPVRTGKSTFIRRFMELVALPQMSDTKQAEIRDQLPLSGSGKIITTAETKFIPKEAVPITLGEDQQVKIRLIDSVGFLVKGASGQTEDGKERMVKTPWFEQAIPFREAARIGTQKVIQEHSTIGIVVTTDGSFGELPRDNFPEAEEKTIQELKKQQKPFIVLVNSQMPYKDAALKTAEEIQQKYKVTALTVNCDQLQLVTVYCQSSYLIFLLDFFRCFQSRIFIWHLRIYQHDKWFLLFFQFLNSLLFCLRKIVSGKFTETSVSCDHNTYCGMLLNYFLCSDACGLAKWDCLLKPGSFYHSFFPVLRLPGCTLYQKTHTVDQADLYLLIFSESDGNCFFGNKFCFCCGNDFA